MRWIEIRRHSYTKKGEARGKGSHLSAEGVLLARKVGKEMGPFDRVLTSFVPRTVETAIAMGFAVDEQIEALGDLAAEVYEEIGHHERWTWVEPFVEFARFIAIGGPTAGMGKRQQEAWVMALESVPDGDSVLIVSHGRIIEAGLVTCISGGDFRSWGTAFGHCEGVRLGYASGQFRDVEFRRVEQQAV